jgi:hypothetical protein
MMELIKRFEESDAEEADLEDDEEVEEEDALAQRLKGVDLGTRPQSPSNSLSRLTLLR